MSQKIYRNQNTLGSATINPCNTEKILMTERELKETNKKRFLYKKGGGGWTNRL